MKKLKLNMISESEFTVKGHGVHTAYVELTNALKRRNDVDVLVNEDREGADVTHIQTVGLYAAKRLVYGPGKKVVSVHVVPDSLIGSLAMAKYWLPLAKIYLKWFYSRADMLFAVSGMVAEELEDSMYIDKKRIKLLYNTVDMSQYTCTPEDKKAARKVLRIADDAFVVVGNGQIQPRKRLDTFVEAAKRLPDVHFIWVGGIPFKQLGAEYSKMKKIVASVPGNLTVTDVIPLEEVRKYVQAADVFFLPAEQENHPMCVLEAAGAGLPIVLRDIPQYADTFAQDSQLISTDQEAVDTITALRTDPKRYKVAVQGAQAIAQRFDSKQGAERAMAFYQELIK
ncbi:glycosyltransferase family 4 protein [Pedobacter sp.]|nr:glycosyltransferase family 4 protein [Candidatus Saccharibacteria bacterium]